MTDKEKELQAQIEAMQAKILSLEDEKNTNTKAVSVGSFKPVRVQHEIKGEKYNFLIPVAKFSIAVKGNIIVAETEKVSKQKDILDAMAELGCFIEAK